MRTILLGILFLSGCLSVPNKPVCFGDAPTAGKCAYMVSGEDFVVDDTGHNNYTLDGHNWTWDQLKANSLVTPPETYAAIKQFFLNWCHQNESKCDPDEAEQNAKEIEDELEASNESYKQR